MQLVPQKHPQKNLGRWIMDTSEGIGLAEVALIAKNWRIIIGVLLLINFLKEDPLIRLREDVEELPCNVMELP